MAARGRLAWARHAVCRCHRHDDATAAAVAETKRGIYPSFFELISVNSSLVELINCACPALKSGLVTSASRASAHAALKHLALFDMFGVIVTSDDCPGNKPDPAPYRLAAEALSVTANECLLSKTAT